MIIFQVIIDIIVLFPKIQVHECPDCDKTFQGRRALNLHLTDVHASKVGCKFCDRKMSKRLLKRHLERRHKNEVENKGLETKQKYSRSKIRQKMNDTVLFYRFFC